MHLSLSKKTAQENRLGSKSVPASSSVGSRLRSFFTASRTRQIISSCAFTLETAGGLGWGVFRFRGWGLVCKASSRLWAHSADSLPGFSSSLWASPSQPKSPYVTGAAVGAGARAVCMTFVMAGFGRPASNPLLSFS